MKLEIIHAETDGRSLRLSATLDGVLFSGLIHQVLMPALEEEE
jgi:hypothetical protein